MDIFSVRQQLKTKSIFDIPLRVTFYARVSSEKDEQLNSLDNQITYYKNYIKKYGVDESELDEYQKLGLVNKYKAFTKPRYLPTFFVVEQ